MLGFCDCCDTYTEVRIMRSGDRICKSCKKQWSKELQKRVKIEKWKKHVRESETNLVRCVKAAAEQGISYGVYMAQEAERSAADEKNHGLWKEKSECPSHSDRIA